MAIPKWRLVRGTDDGCSIYQCLNCKQDWEGRGSPEWGWKFCPYCGCQWKGQQLCREHYTPRWEYELMCRSGKEVSLFDSTERKLIQKFHDLQRPKGDRCWVIEQREVVTNRGEVKYGKWYICHHASPFYETTLIDVVSTMQSIREFNQREYETDSEFDWDYKCVQEFRARIANRSEVVNLSCGSTIWHSRSDLTLLEAWKK